MWLEKYKFQDVEVHYMIQSGYKDRGTVTDFGDQWIELTKTGNPPECLIIPITAIRLLKVASALVPNANTLLRPIYSNVGHGSEDAPIEDNNQSEGR